MSYSVRKPLYEIVQAAAEAQDIIEKVEILRQNNSVSLRKLLRYAIDPSIKFVVEKLPEYTPAAENGLEPLLYNRVRLLYLFAERPFVSLDKKIMERNLVNLLESIHAKDSELLIQVLKKKLPKGLTKQHVIQAFPEILDEQIVELQS